MSYKGRLATAATLNRVLDRQLHKCVLLEMELRKAVSQFGAGDPLAKRLQAQLVEADRKFDMLCKAHEHGTFDK